MQKVAQAPPPLKGQPARAVIDDTEMKATLQSLIRQKAKHI